MSDKLRDAIDNVQSQIDNDEVLGTDSYEELQLILEAAWAYWDLLDE